MLPGTIAPVCLYHAAGLAGFTGRARVERQPDVYRNQGSGDGPGALLVLSPSVFGHGYKHRRGQYKQHAALLLLEIVFGKLGGECQQPKHCRRILRAAVPMQKSGREGASSGVK